VSKGRLEAFSDGVTGWMGENHFAAVPPTAAHGAIMLLAGLAYPILQKTDHCGAREWLEGCFRGRE
jgi:uncharacterized membrane protein